MRGKIEALEQGKEKVRDCYPCLNLATARGPGLTYFLSSSSSHVEPELYGQLVVALPLLLPYRLPLFLSVKFSMLP